MRIRKRASSGKPSAKLVVIVVSVAAMVVGLAHVFRRELDPDYVVLLSTDTLRLLDAGTKGAVPLRKMTISPDDNWKNRTKVVGFTNHPYRAIAAKWYDRLASLGYDEHAIICTDNETAAFLEEDNQPYRRHERVVLPTLPWSTAELGWAKKERLRKLYLFAGRWTYVLENLKKGTHVLLTDVDNIFSRFVPMSDFESSEYDVMHAYETKHPTQVFDQMGFVVCGGMGWFRAEPRTIKFIEIMIDHCGDNCDDQVRLNEVLLRYLDMKWDETLETFGSTALRVVSSDERYNGLLQIGKTGRSGITGHRVKIWDRDFAFRGPLEPDPCPENNWVAMPIYEAQTRQHAPGEKTKSFERWDSKCPSESSIGKASK